MKDLPNLIQNFPFKTTLSLTNVIGYWQAKSADKSAIAARGAQDILKGLEKAPKLLEPIEDLKVLDKHRDLVDAILTAVIPPGMIEDEMMVIVPPFRHEAVYATKSFGRLLNFNNPNFTTSMTIEDLSKKKALFAYTNILWTFYGIDLPVNYEMVITVNDKSTGLDRHLKTMVNPRFCELKVNGDLPKLSEDALNDIVQNMNDIEVWQKYLPSDLFEFQGLSVIRLVDVTGQQVLSNIKVDLLKKDSITSEDKFKDLEENLKVLFRIPDLRLGISSFQKSGDNVHNLGQHIHHSFLISKTEGITCSYGFGKIYEYFNQNPRPVIIPDLEKNPEWGEFNQVLMNQGIKNIAIAPLFYDKQLLGLLELGSPSAGALNLTEVTKVEDIVPLFAAAVQNSSEDMVNRIQGIIKEEYTAIHPSVEWKFTESALGYLDQEERGEKPELKPIVFDEVIPLFGSSDIRGSSTTRNEAIKVDLMTQLKLAKKVFTKAMELQAMPIFDELNYMLEKHLNKLEQGLFSGDETTIIDFLRNEIEPLMSTFQEKYPELARSVKAYNKAIDPELGIVYDKRKDFEQSLTALNDLVSAHIEKQEEKAQAMFPHYFEKYKTDGVEYNIYVGDAIAHNEKYDPIYLKNLRLWQLITTCEVARMTSELKPSLKVPLDMTHLILLHSNPLSIRFRMDEKQFDVDGAYNIRYEIVKKRIDKAYIKNTTDRLTQPNKIAIVYSQDKDLGEYYRYIEYLQKKGYLTDEVENLELEDLQGVRGLRALRVEVNLQKGSKDQLLQEDLIKEVKRIAKVH